jgi:hypothetical protein
MTWRAARSLLILQHQLMIGAPRAKPPATESNAWGLIGNAAHDSTSDHSPRNFPGWGLQIVTAADFPNRPDLGLDAHRVLDDIRRSRDPRAKYGISNGKQFSNHAADGYPAWEWRPYGGEDQHYEHGHLSVVGDARADGEQLWATIGADDMEQSDKLSPPRGDTTVGNALNIAVEVREALVNNDAGTGYKAPKPESFIGKTYARLDAISAKLDALAARPAIDVATLAAALAPLLVGATDEAAVLGALRSPEGQAALVQAANTAEDQ